MGSEMCIRDRCPPERAEGRRQERPTSSVATRPTSLSLPLSSTLCTLVRRSCVTSLWLCLVPGSLLLSSCYTRSPTYPPPPLPPLSASGAVSRQTRPPSLRQCRTTSLVRRRVSRGLGRRVRRCCCTGGGERERRCQWHDNRGSLRRRTSARGGEFAREWRNVGGMRREWRERGDGCTWRWARGRTQRGRLGVLHSLLRMRVLRSPLLLLLAARLAARDGRPRRVRRCLSARSFLL